MFTKTKDFVYNIGLLTFDVDEVCIISVVSQHGILQSLFNISLKGRFRKPCFVNIHVSREIIMFLCAFCCRFDQKYNKRDTTQVGVIALTTLDAAISNFQKLDISH